MKNIYGMTLEKLEQYFESINEKKYRALQIYEWLYQRRIRDIKLFSNIKDDLKNTLIKDFSFDRPEIVKIEKDEETAKYLFKLQDGKYIESVLMHHNYGNSVCVSSQVGCNMGCLFCASGKLKKERNLTASEMVSQIMIIEEDMKVRISHVVIMGIGEPFDNYDNVLDFIKIINNDKGMAIGARHITVSTCGIIPKIEAFMKENLQVNLAISLHGADNETRGKLMPINKVYDIDSLIDVLKKYVSITNRRLTFEYILLDNVNDSKEDALKLVKLLKGINCYVNLIPYNETNSGGFKRSSKNKILAFFDILKKNNIQVTIRREFGSKVTAACGQLRANYTSKGVIE